MKDYLETVELARSMRRHADCVLTYVKSVEFQIAFEDLDPVSRTLLDNHIQHCEPELLRRFINKHKKQDILVMSIRELRQEASKLGITNYAYYTKAELLSRIVHARKNQRTSQSNEGSDSQSGSQ